MVSPVSMSLSSVHAPSFQSRGLSSRARAQNLFEEPVGIVSEKKPRVFDLNSWVRESHRQKIYQQIYELEKNGGSKMQIAIKKAQLLAGWY